MSRSVQRARPTETVEPERLTTDDVFEVLSNHRRRYALHHLQRDGPRADLGTLSEHVASWENGTTVSDVNAAQRKRVYTSLQQFHLPKMEELGVVRYDERAGVVELTESARDLDVYLEVVHERDIPWSQYYLGLAAVEAALVSAVLVGAYPFTLLPPVAWLAFVVTTVTISALVHTYYSSAMRLGASEEPPELEQT